MDNFEELKLYWNKLNVNANIDEETNRRILETLKKKNYKSCVDSMINKSYLYIAILILVMFICLVDNNFHLIPHIEFHPISFVILEFLPFCGFVSESYKVIILSKIDYTDGPTVIKRRIESLKRHQKISTYCGVVLLILSLVAFSYLQGLFCNVTAMTTFVLGTIVICIITYLETLSENKRFKELEDGIDD